MARDTRPRAAGGANSPRCKLWKCDLQQITSPTAKYSHFRFYTPLFMQLAGRETQYEARKRKRRVIIKAEVVRHEGRAPKDNPRFVVTNLEGWPRRLYERVYCGRGDIENRLKEHHGLEIDRSSCSSFMANQLRVLLTAAAYVLMQELRLSTRRDCALAQVSTLRERLLKVGVWVERSVRRIALHLPDSFAYLKEWLRIARSVGAVPA